MLETLLLSASILSAYQVVDTTTSSPAPLVDRDAITVSFGEESFEQFQVVHVSTPWAHKPMVMVTPLGFGPSWYESNDDYEDSLLGRLAYLGVDVWVLEQRRGTADTLPFGSCPDPFNPGAPAPVDCSPFGAWGIEDLADDAAFVRTLIPPGSTPTIGGQWTGAMAAMGIVDTDPAGYSGLLLWEGAIFTDEPFTLAKNSATCAAIEPIPDIFGADPTVANEQLATGLAQADPDGISPFPPQVLAPFGLVAGVATNLDLLHAIFIADAPTLPDRVAEGLVFMVGTIEDGPDIAELGQVFNIANTPPAAAYSSLGLLEEYACALGGDPEHVSNLDAFTGDVFAIGSDRGLVDELQDSLDAFGSARYAYADFRGEFGVHDLLWSDFRFEIDVEIALFNLIAQL
ncbi:MAG: hypothetical protein K0U16_07335 [Gammaproteobacteria bacterium]|nr:hypothetical protein [Gammaproteobacteria bacterium]